MNHIVQTLKWVLVIRGLVAVLFGLAAIFLPGLTIKALIILFGLTILVDGFINLIGAVQSRKDIPDWWVYLLEGAFSLTLGFITILWPALTGFAFLFIIASWAIVSGIGKMVAAIGLRKMIEGELVLLLSGILSVIFGVVMLVFPEFTVSAYVAVIGFFSLLIGFFFFVLAWRIKQEHQNVPNVKITQLKEDSKEVKVEPKTAKDTAKSQSSSVQKTVVESSSTKSTKPKVEPKSKKTSTKTVKSAKTSSKKK
jgi:uncharacterized membrane protein HdeD (DUF308 family)